MKLYSAAELDKHIDERGFLRVLSLPPFEIKTILHCSGLAGSIRANHVHTADEHMCYVTKGTIQYSYTEEGETKTVILLPGDAVYTPAGESHKLLFITNGEFLSFAKMNRTQESYEHDTQKTTI